MKGLIIRQPHIERILSGEKTWEMRSTSTKIRGRIALIEAGTGMIMGEADLFRVQDAPTKLRSRHFTRCYHGLEESEFHLMDKWKFAWVLENVLRYDKPLAYEHPQGAVIWVDLKF